MDGSKLQEILREIPIDVFRLELADLKEGRTGSETYFNAWLHKNDSVSLNPILQGLYFQGRDKFVKPWVEFRYNPVSSFPGDFDIDLDNIGFTGVLFARLRLLVGPGGSLMVIYGGENHPLYRETEKGLKLGFPEAATPLGFRLWESGCRWFKDWYFSEGWREGAMKLQASYPLDDSAAKKSEARIAAELSGFVAEVSARDPSLFQEEALARARHILFLPEA